jgi:hypothetical protein
MTQEAHKFWGFVFHSESIVSNFKESVGPLFGRFFHKLIWSPCPHPSIEKTESTQVHLNRSINAALLTRGYLVSQMFCAETGSFTPGANVTISFYFAGKILARNWRFYLIIL